VSIILPFLGGWRAFWREKGRRGEGKERGSEGEKGSESGFDEVRVRGKE
jgi:hypothetical protein